MIDQRWYEETEVLVRKITLVTDLDLATQVREHFDEAAELIEQLRAANVQLLAELNLYRRKGSANKMKAGYVARAALAVLADIGAIVGPSTALWLHSHDAHSYSATYIQECGIVLGPPEAQFPAPVGAVNPAARVNVSAGGFGTTPFAGGAFGGGTRGGMSDSGALSVSEGDPTPSDGLTVPEAARVDGEELDEEEG